MATLDELNTRRAAVLALLTRHDGVESYGISGGGHGRNVQRTSRKELREELREIDAQIAAMQSGGGFNYAVRGNE